MQDDSHRPAHKRQFSSLILERVAATLVPYIARLKLTVTVSTKRSGVPFKSNGE